MTAIGEMVQTLIAAGTPPDVAAVVVAEAYAAGMLAGNSSGIPPESRLEKIRAADRERKRNRAVSSGIPLESTGIPETALILKKDTYKKEKKVRATKHPLPPEFQPTEDHFAYGAERGYSRDGVLDKAEDMRIWAGSSGAQKADWGLTLLGFLRRDAPKREQSLSLTNPNLRTITPQSRSWNAWKSHFRDAGKNSHAAIMDRCASDGKPFTVQSEWPPGMAA
jgi:hypothetical protein